MNPAEPVYKPHGVDGALVMLLRTLLFCVLPAIALLVGVWLLRQATWNSPIAPLIRALYFATFGLVGAIAVAYFAAAVLNRRKVETDQPKVGVGFGMFTTTFRHTWVDLDHTSADAE
jgi:chromate transport protein ChrA